MASADFPAPVGPQMTRTLLSPETPIELIPGDLHDRGSPVHIVGGQRGVGETDVERLHLGGRQEVAAIDGGLARDGRRETLVARRGAGHAVAGERVERITETAQRVEPRVWHRHGRHDNRVPPERLDLETELRERVAVRLERIALCWSEMKRGRKKEPLRWRGAAFQHVHELFEEDALVRGMLVDEHQTFTALEHEIGAPELHERGNVDG